MLFISLSPAGTPTSRCYVMLHIHTHVLVLSPDEADMREVSHFLLERRNGSESREVVHDIPFATPENKTMPDADPPAPHPPPVPPAGVDPFEAASPATKASADTFCSLLARTSSSGSRSKSRKTNMLL